ncbi:hypothetical protein SUDANB95_07935 (plasmid) [Actinosynnema sp. ALI-1.44]
MRARDRVLAGAKEVRPVARPAPDHNVITLDFRPTPLDEATDSDLLDMLRNGDTTAYAELYRRHAAAAFRSARRYARSPDDVQDLVADTFTKVFSAITGGRGPNSAFRAYLLTAMRHHFFDSTRRQKVRLTDDLEDLVPAEALAVPFDDPTKDMTERVLAAQAFSDLPERWRTVLWHTLIEQRSPSQVAALLGLPTANAGSALAKRAREGLRAAFKRMLLDHRATAQHQGSVISPVSADQRARHLAACRECQTRRNRLMTPDLEMSA